MLELHCAHGYLLASFISPLTNRPHRRVRRLARKPAALSARSVRRDARRLAEAASRCRCASPPPTGPRAASPATTRWRSRARSREAGVDLIDVSTGQTVRDAQPIYRPHVPDRHSPIRSATRPGRDHVRRQHHHRRPGRTPSSPPAAPTSWRWRGRISSIRLSRCVRRPGTAPIRLSAAISAGQGTDLPQQRARPSGFRGPQN